MIENKKTTITTLQPEKTKKTPLWIFFIGFLILAVFLLLIAEGMKKTNPSPVRIGQIAPEFSFISFENDTILPENIRGKIVVVNFWASWCKPCEQEAAELQEAYEKNKSKGDVLFLGVDYVDTETEAREYLQKFKITYPNGPDLRTMISQTFRISGVPETYFIDKTGKLAEVKIGPFSSTEEILNVIESLR